MAHTEEPLLRVSGITKSFGDNRVLDGVDFEVGRGEVVCLIGPSGSGKTTVLRSLNALETPDAGVLEFAGGQRIDFGARQSKQQRAALRDRSAMVFQHHNLFPHLTVLENVIEGPVRAHGVAKVTAVTDAERLLDRVGLSAKRDAYPHQLSGGQQQRVGIVRALALQPDLLLFDEPTSALDPELVGEVLIVLKELADEGWTMVIVTHELGFARRVADEVLFFDGGVIVERGAPKQLFAQPRNERTRRFLDRILRPLDE
ncbi:amino acid ABC transporter ATP-binding protein [Microbacterium protaetiae]|uniref:Amino acid ABC transporter ATP-binding protein n=1 Tax=Microbacterium protaetiae TaxID=2509458 RepID=A0A4P6EGF6_9MICO|nr:amino acid ABC transporter ATP-binding protein [Microbacterium protaetiae]QAY60523.1 amino acid ABC transporter ATP-binding protein [Microbacterium protaetiae]